MPSVKAFESFYFDNTFLLSHTISNVDLGKVTNGKTVTFTFLGNRSVIELETITFDLEDTTYTLTVENGQDGDDALSLSGLGQITGPYDSFDIVLEFGNPPKDPQQSATLTAAGLVVPMVFDRRVLFSLMPQSGVKETLEFVTTVTEAWDGTEQRSRVRAYPRSRIEMEFVDNSEGTPLYWADILGSPGRRFSCVMQHRFQEVDAVSFNGITELWEVTVTEGDLDRSLQAATDGDPITFYDQSAGDHKQGILGQDPSSTVLYFENGTLVPAVGDLVIPTEEAVLMEEPSLTVWPTRASEYATTWVVDKLPLLPTDLLDSSTGYSGLAPEVCDFDTSKPVLRAGTLRGNARRMSSQSGSILFDRTIGKISPFFRKGTPAVTIPVYFDITEDATQAQALRDFLIWTWGRQKSFYFPTNLQEIEIGTIISNQFTAIIPSFISRVDLADGLAAVDITKTDGTTHQFQITTLSFDQDTGGAIFQADRGIGFTASSVASVSLLLHVRLASDSITLEYQNKNSVTCGFNLVTVKQ